MVRNTHIWEQVVNKTRKERPLISIWVDSVSEIQVGDEIVTIKFPSTAKIAADFFKEKDDARSFLQQAISDALERNVKLEIA